VASREKNTLSAMIRTAWDGKTISPLVKNSKWKASHPHIVITAHITSFELIAKMTNTDAQSGFMNRFIILHIVRPKLVPLPKRTPDKDIDRVAAKVAEAVKFAIGSDVTNRNGLKVTLSPEAENLWRSVYPEMTKEHDGIRGSLLARTEIYCRMLAMIFALLDKTAVIEVRHFQAAFAWINYWIDSVHYIFGNLASKIKAEKLEKDAKSVYEFICKNSGCTRTEITRFYKNKPMGTVEITKALNHLTNASPPLVKQDKKPRSDGKPGKGKTVFWKV
jgi:hypothetical protein